MCIRDSFCRELMNKWLLSDRSNTTFQKQITSRNEEQTDILIDYISSGLTTLKLQFISSFYAFLDTALRVEGIKFGVYLVSLITLFVVVWLPYVKLLNEKIWRVKGILNLIPINVIFQNENLKSRINNQNFVAAIK
eukprot:TRINITY_DN2603_c0_g1_i5.p1 TRINITY_DN2603_c0_g1~~TRINITY_DN2603_c0_g1_i5.p1  ORF type:complete len:156 (-),score=25.79 TRINITY_DN2603_c0_g1_i5:19-426(-)